MTRYFLVERGKGPDWDHGRSRRDQEGWDAHAAFMDGLVDDGFVVLGGPVGGDDGERVALVVCAADEEEIHRRFAADPWPAGMLTFEGISPWSLWLDGRAGSRGGA